MLGAERLVYGSLNGETMTVRIDEGAPFPKSGETMRVRPSEERRLHWFDAESGKRI